MAESSTVTLTRCSGYSQPDVAAALERQFELLGGVGRFVRRGDTVLLKPNFIAPRPRYCATQTDPAVILEVARLLKDAGARPVLGDSPAWGNVFSCVKALELAEPLRKLAVPVRQLNKPRQCKLGQSGVRVGISRLALEADAIVNLPKFKTHQQLLTTFAVKNMFGCVSGKRKTYWHFARGSSYRQFCRLLIDIYVYLRPVVSLIDAITVMDGAGPIRGRARALGWIIGGTDAIACETVCAQLVNIDPAEVPLIRTARQMGIGCSEPRQIKVLGEDFANSVCMDFELPRLVPIRFSLLHVCRSVCKQTMLLARAAGGKLVPRGSGGRTDRHL